MTLKRYKVRGVFQNQKKQKKEKEEKEEKCKKLSRKSKVEKKAHNFFISYPNFKRKYS